MTQPYEFSPVVEQSHEKRDRSEFLPWARCAERKTASGHVIPGKMLLVRPLEVVDDTRPLREGEDPNKWRGKLVIVDAALLDALPYIPDNGLGEELLGFAAGTIFRNNTVKLGYLNKAFREMVGKLCIGTVYTQPPKEQGFQPSIHWRDLALDETAKARGRSFLQAFPDFLIPVPMQQFTPAVPQQAPPQQGYGQPQGAPAPVSPAPGGWAQSPGDPWAQQASQPVSPAPGHPNAGMSTLDQLRQAAQVAQGQQQPQDPPF